MLHLVCHYSLVLYLFEPYCAMALDTHEFNRFDTLQILAPQMAASQFEPIKWHVRTLLKDLDTAVKLSQQIGSATPLSGLAAQLMRQHGSHGNLERDPATLVDLYRESPVHESQS